MTNTHASFVHLRLHTEFSLVDSTLRIKPLVKKIAEMGMPAVGISDVCNFYGLIKFYTAAQHAGVKPIIGADFWVRASSDKENSDKPTLVTLLAMNHQGYRNIIVLISRAFQEGQYHGDPYLLREWISECSEGVIALSGGRYGDIGSALLSDHADEARANLAAWLEDFPNRFYIELQRTGRENEEDYLHAAVALAAERQVPVVATNDVRFLTADDFEAHESRVCIGEGRTLDDPRREHRYSDQQYLRTSEEMVELFSDIPHALANTLEVAKRCNVDIELGYYSLPDYLIPDHFSKDQFFEHYYSYSPSESLALQAMQDLSPIHISDNTTPYLFS